MKKYLALLLAGVMMLSLVACGEKQITDDEQTGNEAGNGPLSSVVDLNTDWLPYDENGDLKLTERDAEGKNGVVTSANYYASKIGEKIIEQGGNAIDAAVAMGFAMSTVESYYSGLGGGGYMLIRFAETGETVFLDFRETAPTGANPDWWPKNEDGSWGGYYDMQLSPQGIAVPGYVKGMMYALENYGTIKTDEPRTLDFSGVRGFLVTNVCIVQRSAA